MMSIDYDRLYATYPISPATGLQRLQEFTDNEYWTSVDDGNVLLRDAQELVIRSLFVEFAKACFDIFRQAVEHGLPDGLTAYELEPSVYLMRWHREKLGVLNLSTERFWVDKLQPWDSLIAALVEAGDASDLWMVE